MSAVGGGARPSFIRSASLVAIAIATLTTRAHAGDGQAALIGKHGGAGIPQEIYAPHRTARQPGTFGMNLEALAALPLGLGAGLTLEGPFGLRAGLSVGAMPTSFLTLALQSIRQPGAYTAEQAEAILDHLEDPLFMRVSFALCPPDWGGFYLGVGYGFLRVAASLKAGDIDSSMWPAIAGINSQTYAGLAVVSHHLAADIGWEFELSHHWRLRASVGGIFTLASQASISASGLTKVATEEVRRAQTREAEAAIEDAVVAYGSIPSVTIALSYRIF